jgi:hypothetical protein
MRIDKVRRNNAIRALNTKTLFGGIRKRQKKYTAGEGLTLMKEFMMDMALEEIPVSGCTCLRTL